MEENSGTPLKDDGSNSLPEELTKEKLIMKCKNLLTIAQKAKKARDDHAEKNKLLLEDSVQLNSKVQKLEKDLVTAQEMLASFTEQKLKMCVTMDELKKDRKQLNEDLLKMSEIKDQLETENISLKRQYTRMITENEELIDQLGQTENRLKNAVAVKTDLNKLQENNENIKLLCSNVTREKLDLEKECDCLTEKINLLEKQMKQWQNFVSSKFSVDSCDVNDWISALESQTDVKGNSSSDSNDLKMKLSQEIDKNNKINLELKQTLSALSSCEADKNELQIKLSKYRDINQQLRNDLDSLNQDKDKLLNNLENMRIETRQLIESSEKLSEEIEILKNEKSRVENKLIKNTEENNYMNLEMNKLNEIINNLNRELMEKDKASDRDESSESVDNIEHLKSQITVLNRQINDLNKSSKDQIDFITNRLDRSLSNEKLLEKELTNSHDELKLIKSELESLRDSLNNKQIELNDISEQNKNYKKIENEMKENLLVLNNELECAKEALVQARCERSVTSDPLDDYRVECEKELNELKIKYDILNHELEQTKKGFELSKNNEDDLKTQLKITCENVDILKSQLKNKEDNVEALKNDLKTKDENLEALKDDLKTKEDNLEALKNDLKTKDENLEALKKDLKTKGENLEALKNDLKTKEDNLQALKNDLKTKEDNLEALKNNLKTKEDNLEALKNDLKTKEDNLEAWKNDLKTKEEDFKALKNELKTKDENLDALTNELKTKGDNLEALKAELNSKKDNLEALNNELKAQEENVKVLKNKLEKKVETVNCSLLTEKEECIRLLKTQLDEMKRASENNDDSLNKQLESLRFEKEELKCLIDTLKEEASDTTEKLTEELNSKQELLSQSLIRENKLFEEFKINLNELQLNNDKITSEYNEMDKYCNDKCLEVEKLTQESIDKEQKIENLLTELTDVKKQLCDLSQLLNEANKLNNKYELRIKELENNLKELKLNKDKLLEDKQENLLKELNILKTLLQDNKEELDNKNGVINTLQRDIEKQSLVFNEISEEFERNRSEMINNKNNYEKHVDELTQNYESIKTELSTKQSELDRANDQLSKLHKELSNNREKLNETDSNERKLTEITDKYRIEINNLEMKLSERSQELVSCRRNWIGHLTILKGAFFGLKISYEDLKKSVCDLKEFLAVLSLLRPSNFQEKIEFCVEKSIQSNKQDLLGEMQRMNQALKQRGEVISKLQNSLSEIEQKLKKSSEDNEEIEKNLTAKIEEKEKQLKLKESFIRDLEFEISKMKENNDSVTDADMMSSSTISKVEESNRLKDIEDSFEDKYTKMKLLAMKLKKRVNDLSSALEEEKNRSAADRNELIDKVQTLTTAAKNAQKLQESFDAVMDQFDEEKKKCKTLETNLQSCCQNNEQLEELISKLESDNSKIPNMRNHIESLTLNLSRVKKEVSSLQKEKQVETIKYNEIKKEKLKLEEKILELTSSLEQVKQQTRNKNLLELEMSNYEKTIEDLSSQLNGEKERMENVKSEMESVICVKSGLEEQIKLLENQIKIEQERNTLSNKQLLGTKENLLEVQSVLNEKTERCDVLERELQEEKHKYENLALQASSLTSQFTSKEKELETQLSSFQRIVCSLESKVSSRDEEISRCQSELERVQSEFDTYRTRAQAVLAKQRSETVSHAEREQTEQIDKLNHQNTMLTSKIDSLVCELEMLKTESLTYKHEKERSDRRIEELNKLLQYKTMEIDKINSEFRNFKISTETLKQCFKTELEEKELSYKTLLDNYKHQIEDLTNSNKLLESQIEPNNSNNNIIRSAGDVEHDSLVETLPQRREEGEGSESVPSPQIRKKSTNLVPLDVLLNTPYDSESRIGLLCDRISLLEKEVSSYEVRCRHLAGLLSEAERDSARNSQLNALLKEEIRRLERSLQRQPHAANTEYLKNVIFKFVTLQSGDERSRLVPVLDTILKLSPEENHKLHAVARGEVGSGWSNYLPAWPSL